MYISLPQAWEMNKRKDTDISIYTYARHLAGCYQYIKWRQASERDNSKMKLTVLSFMLLYVWSICVTPYKAQKVRHQTWNYVGYPRCFSQVLTRSIKCLALKRCEIILLIIILIIIFKCSLAITQGSRKLCQTFHNVFSAVSYRYKAQIESKRNFVFWKKKRKWLIFLKWL